MEQDYRRTVFGSSPELGGDPFLWQALAAEPKDFSDFNHGDAQPAVSPTSN